MTSGDNHFNAAGFYFALCRQNLKVLPLSRLRMTIENEKTFV